MSRNYYITGRKRRTQQRKVDKMFCMNCSSHDCMCEMISKEQEKAAEKWPRYYLKTICAVVLRLSESKCMHIDRNTISGPCDWLSVYDRYVAAGNWSELSENEAERHLGLLRQPKVRFRLWFDPNTGEVVADSTLPAPEYVELHHDSEGFYVEGGQL